MRKHGFVPIWVLGLSLVLAACPNPMVPDNGDEGEDPIQVTGVPLAGSMVSVPAGGTSQLSAAVLPANATDSRIAWSSSDEAVATVSATQGS